MTTLAIESKFARHLTVGVLTVLGAVWFAIAFIGALALGHAFRQDVLDAYGVWLLVPVELVGIAGICWLQCEDAGGLTAYDLVASIFFGLPAGAIAILFASFAVMTGPIVYATNLSETWFPPKPREPSKAKIIMRCWWKREKP